MSTLRITLAALVTGAVHLVSSSPAAAQGCILLRQTSPLFGTTSQQEVGSWTLTLTARSSKADIHYNGTVRQRQRETEGTYVVNRQNSITATLSYQLSPRLSLNAGIPYIEASWGIPSPRSGGPEARANENAHGLGDITTFAVQSDDDAAKLESAARRRREVSHREQPCDGRVSGWQR